MSDHYLLWSKKKGQRMSHLLGLSPNEFELVVK